MGGRNVDAVLFPNPFLLFPHTTLPAACCIYPQIPALWAFTLQLSAGDPKTALSQSECMHALPPAPLPPPPLPSHPLRPPRSLTLLLWE